jgi:hypothetical protein
VFHNVGGTIVSSFVARSVTEGKILDGRVCPSPLKRRFEGSKAYYAAVCSF